MAYHVKRYGLDSTAMAQYIGPDREIVVNVTTKALHVHDGVTPGGWPTARADLVNVAEATETNAGKMTAVQVQNLNTIFAELATINQNVADIATLQSEVSLLQTDVANLSSDLASHIAGNMHFPAGTVLVALQSTAPPGWTIITTFDNRALFLKGTFNGEVKAGGAVGGTVDPGKMAGSDVPQHTHGGTGSGAGVSYQEPFYSGEVLGVAPGTGVDRTQIQAGTTGAISTTLSVAANTGPTTWTPNYATGIAIQRDVF